MIPQLTAQKRKVGRCSEISELVAVAVVLSFLPRRFERSHNDQTVDQVHYLEVKRRSELKESSSTAKRAKWLEILKVRRDQR